MDQHGTGADDEPGERLGYRMMALEVEDMDAALALLKARGVEPSWGPVRRPSYARAEIRDADGNAIELRQWITPAQSGPRMT